MYYLLKGGSENKRVQIICSKSNSITFYRSLGMRNQAETQFSKILSIICLELGLRTIGFKIFAPNAIISCSICLSGCAIKKKHKRNGPKGLQFSKILCFI